jgi:hypothetical protein
VPGGGGGTGKLRRGSVGDDEGWDMKVSSEESGWRRNAWFPLS